MTNMGHYEPGTFSWVDLMARDQEKARDFYTRLFDWDSQAQSDDGGNRYIMFEKDGHPVAGLGQMPDHLVKEGMPNLWNSYVAVEDVEATVKTTRDNGGNVVLPPMNITTAGRMAIITDPEGANLCLWQPGAHAGAGVVNAPGSFCWNELACRDMSQAKAFYKTLFGWDFEENTQTSATYHIVKNQGRENGGMLQMSPEWGDAPSHWSVYFSVDDMTARIETLKELGGRIAVGPFPTAHGQIAVAEDDQQGHFYLIHRES